MIPGSGKIATLILLAALLIVPASAVESVTLENVYTWNLDDTDDLTISSLRVSKCAPGSTQVINLNAYGQNYTITATGEKSWAAYWDFNISCQYPNGTTEYRELHKFHPIPLTYTLHVQKFYAITGLAWELDVEMAMVPSLHADFTPDVIESEYGQISFSEVSGTSTSEVDVTAWFVTPEEFQGQQDWDLRLIFGKWAEDIFDWTWDGVLYAVGKIPYVGGHLETFLLIAGFALEEVAFWLYLFFVEYPELTFGMVEFLIICDALLNTRSLWKLLERIVNDHVKLGEFLLKLIIGAIDMITKFMSAIAAIIGSIIP